METSSAQEHWDSAYEAGGESGVSWFQESAATSLDLIREHADVPVAVIDVGGGSSRLVDGLLDAGFDDVAVLDVSDSGLAISRERLGSGADAVNWIVGDLLTWSPDREYGVWHDRAVLHFLVDDDDLRAYKAKLLDAVSTDGIAVVGVFAEDGPERCSGLKVRRRSLAELADLLAPEFKIIEQRREIHVTPGARDQAFNWVVAHRSTNA